VVDAHQSEHKLIWSKALLRGNTLQTVDPVVCKSRFDSPGEFPKKVVPLFRCSFIVSSFKLTHFTKLSLRSQKPKPAFVIHTSSLYGYPSRGFGGRRRTHNNWTSNTGQSYRMHKPYSPDHSCNTRGIRVFGIFRYPPLGPYLRLHATSIGGDHNSHIARRQRLRSAAWSRLVFGFDLGLRTYGL
jgi:hypothetical protein